MIENQIKTFPVLNLNPSTNMYIEIEKRFISTCTRAFIFLNSNTI